MLKKKNTDEEQTADVEKKASKAKLIVKTEWNNTNNENKSIKGWV